MSDAAPEILIAILIALFCLVFSVVDWPTRLKFRQKAIKNSHWNGKRGKPYGARFYDLGEKDRHEHEHRLDEKTFWKLSSFTTIAAIVVATFGVLFAVATFRDAHKALVAVQRAFVFPTPSEYLVPNLNARIGGWQFGPEWENDGNTPTVNLKFVTGCGGALPEFIDPLSEGDINLIQTTSLQLGPKQKTTAGVCDISDHFIELVKSGQIKFYLISIANYNDIFGNSHITESCQRIKDFFDDPQPVSVKRLLVVSGACDKYNSLDEQCEESKWNRFRPKENVIDRIVKLFGLD